MARGIVIAGTHSGCGKTTVTLGLLAALKKKGLKVQAFKTGPDFIDSGLHRLITGRPSRNLDTWMCGEEVVRRIFTQYALEADLSVVEGVMGMYDGKFNTASLAVLLELPVLLVIDAYGLAESAGAIVKGFSEYGLTRSPAPSERFPLIAGVVFNRVASEKHFSRLKSSVSNATVLGYLPRDINFEIPHRHLGLVVAEEDPISDEQKETLAKTVLEHIDVDQILTWCTARSCSWSGAAKQDNIPTSPPLNRTEKALFSSGTGDENPPRSPFFKGGRVPPLWQRGVRGDFEGYFRVKIAVAYDKAFCFYYEDNLDLLKSLGAELVTFSPTSDRSLPPNVEAVYLGGGYPELYARELSGHKGMIESIYEWARACKPIYAECGGLMYLSQGIYNFDKDFFPMTGVFPFETVMKKGRSFLGYREIELKEDCMLGLKGHKVRGHEFHYSDIKEKSQFAVCNLIFTVRDDSGQYLRDEGYRYKNTLASYIHVHFGSNARIAYEFINCIRSAGNLK